MNLLGLFKRKQVGDRLTKNMDRIPSPESYSTFSYRVSYNGEKNLGEIGPIRDYVMQYDELRLRSWQALTESELASTILRRHATWVIGKGLKPQAEPVIPVLESEGIKLNPQDFSEIVESRFNVFAKSRESDYSNMVTLNRIAKRAFLNAKVGGDVLVVLRYVKEQLTVQLIDGAHVCSPGYGFNLGEYKIDTGNTVRHGIELLPNGEHAAYWVRNKNLSWDRIPAKGKKSGMVMAYMVYGLEHRLDDVRGVPLIAVVLETLKKLERYKEATVGGAEERQKVPYTVEHQLGSTGENPIQRNMAKAFNANASDDIPIDEQGRRVANTVAASTNKMVFNMPQGSKLAMHDSKMELSFKDFYTTNADVVCACINIPPNVAMSKYDSNFSASRAALKDWEHTLHVERDDFGTQFYQPIYNFLLEVMVLSNKITAPGYLKARIINNIMVIVSYQSVRWVGTTVPHIDPEKEVRAERLKLGDSATHIPLTTVEASAEALNTGESDSNMEQFARELEYAKKLKIINNTTEAQ